MKLDFGSEQRFSEFIGNLNDEDVVALISHTDLDGIASAYVTNKVVDADIVKFVNYGDLAEPLIHYLKEKNVTKVIFTDLNIKDERFMRDLERFAEILILDHHITPQDWNSTRTVFIRGEEGYSAGYLCYWLFSKIQDLEKIDWIVACSCVSDYCYIKPHVWLSKVFEKYNDKLESVETYVRMSGPMWEVQDTLSLALIYYADDLHKVFDGIGEQFADIGTLKDAASQVRAEVERLVSAFDHKKQVFEGGYLYEFNPRFSCGSIVSNIISGKLIHSAILTLRPDAEEAIYHISARRQDKTVNMADFLKTLFKGMEGADAGGHVPAAGGRLPMKYLAEFKRRLGVKAWS